MGHGCYRAGRQRLHADAGLNGTWAIIERAYPPPDMVVADPHARGFERLPGNKRVGAFGDSAELCEQLLALIRAGKKRGGAYLLWSYQTEDEALPVAGDIEIVVNPRR